MDRKITAAIVAVAVAVEAILPHHEASPHTEVEPEPPDSGKDIPSIDGRRLNTSATLKLIATSDLLTLPTSGRHYSLAEIAERARTHEDDLT
jgi:hypothetical protein